MELTIQTFKPVLVRSVCTFRSEIQCKYRAWHQVCICFFRLATFCSRDLVTCVFCWRTSSLKRERGREGGREGGQELSGGTGSCRLFLLNAHLLQREYASMDLEYMKNVIDVFIKKKELQLLHECHFFYLEIIN